MKTVTKIWDAFVIVNAFVLALRIFGFILEKVALAFLYYRLKDEEIEETDPA